MAAITIVMRTMGTSDTAEMCDMPRRSRWSFCQITQSARHTGMAIAATPASTIHAHHLNFALGWRFVRVRTTFPSAPSRVPMR